MLNSKQQQAYDLVVKGQNVFVTGGGGCGKTFLIKHLKEMEGTLNINISVTALTGIAATLISGQTLHSWAGIGGNTNKSKDTILKDIMRRSEVVQRWLTTDLLIIDEISMMPIELFHILNYVGQKIRGNEGVFFGGLQILFSGDFCQLPPASSFSRFIFESKHWKDNFNKENTIYLTEIIRQKDPILQKVLSEIRLGRISSETRKLLNSRVIDTSKTENQLVKNGIKPTILFPYNREVDKINNEELNKLLATGIENHLYKAEDSFVDWKDKTRELKKRELKELNEMLDNTCRGLREIVLCIGAQVILTINLDFEKELVNGSRGVITGFKKIRSKGSEDNSPNDGYESSYYPIVKFDTGTELTIDPFSWNIDHPKYNISRKQIPLIHGWSISIHKSQGSTLSLMVTDLKQVFSSGQAYVALSRVKSLEGLYLQGISYAKIKCDSRVRDYYNSLEQ